jgi:hypothetical protein
LRERVIIVGVAVGVSGVPVGVVVVISGEIMVEGSLIVESVYDRSFGYPIVGIEVVTE